MSLDLDLQLVSTSSQIPTEEQIRSWATAALMTDSDQEMEVTIRIVDAAESQQLNHQYRGTDRPTNVLSFPFEAPPGVELSLLGDLVICAPIVEQEAAEQQKTLTAHWAHMTIHGMLHLQRYDHILDRDAEVMENLEKDLMYQLGFDNPYAADEL